MPLHTARIALLVALTGAAMMPVSAQAMESTLESEIGAELIFHPQDGLHPGQRDFFPGLTLQTRWLLQSDDGRHSFTATPYGRYDGGDSGRTHADFRELHWLGVFGNWEWLIGASKVFWGKTEFLHLVDIINQTDTLEGIDGEDKLGQPMLRATWTANSGNLQIYALPWFRERRFVNQRGRFRPEPRVRDGRALYESGAEQRHVDVALRWEGYLGDLDYGIALFEGTQRNPKLFPDQLPPAALIPFYGQLRQASIDAQYTAGNWLWKLEAVHRKEYNRALQVALQSNFPGSGDLAAALDLIGGPGNGGAAAVGATPIANLVPASAEFVAATGGFEYSFYGVRDTDIDVGIVAEYLWDERGIDADTLFQDDLFVATRIAGNDINANTLLAGVVLDLEFDSLIYSVEYSRRIGDSAKLSIEARVFDNIDDRDRLAAGIARDDLIQLTLSRYF